MGVERREGKEGRIGPQWGAGMMAIIAVRSYPPHGNLIWVSLTLRLLQRVQSHGEPLALQ